MMLNQNDLKSKTKPRCISRRDFLKIAATTALVASCSPATPPATPTPAPTATATPTEIPPTRTPRPTPTLIPVPTTDVQKPDLIKTYPAKKSKVIQTRHAGVWDDDALSPEALRAMLAASITALTGINDARQAWSALFKPEERVAIKVNAFRNSLIWTHMPLVTAVTHALQEAGIPAENIVIFDYYTSELENVGYTLNRDGPGVRCYGTDRDYTRGWQIVGSTIELSDVLLGCDALINMPVLKSHRITGLTFAMKNHYGTLSTPQSFHSGDRRDMGMPELNALPPIKDHTRLIIGDILEACLKPKNAYPYWEADWRGDEILMSFDPVAHDTVGLQRLTDLMTTKEINAEFATQRAMPWLENGEKIGLGAHAPENIDIMPIAL